MLNYQNNINLNGVVSKGIGFRLSLFYVYEYWIIPDVTQDLSCSLKNSWIPASAGMTYQ